MALGMGGLAKDHPPHPVAAPQRPPPPPSPPRPPTRRIALPAAAARIPLTPEVGSQTNVVAFQQLVDGLLHKGHVPGVVDAERGARGTGSGSGSPASARRAHSAPARARPASRQPISDPTSGRSKPPPPAPGPRRCRKAFLPQSPTSLRRAPARGRGRPAAVATRSRGCCCCCHHRRRAGPERRRRRGRGRRRAGGRSGPGGRSPGAGALGGRRRGRSRPRAAPAPYESAVTVGLRAPSPAAVAAAREVRGGAGVRPQIRSGHCGRGPRLRGAWQGGGWATEPAPLSSL